MTESESDVAAVRAVIRSVEDSIAADLTGGHYLDYVEGGDRRHGVARGTTPGAYQRLALPRARIDPDNLFNHGLDVTR